MNRHHADWLKAFLDYTSFSESPRYMHFWTGVSTIAGALRRKVWFDMGYAQWFPNFYIVFVAPPGIVAKSTTMGMGMRLLRQIPEIKFGPDIVTWPALVGCFAESTETFQVGDNYHTMSAITLASSEFGNLLDPRDKAMVDLLVHLWDGEPGNLDKRTKHSGSDVVENPWINIIACTTPAWIAGNFPEYIIGGGFTSRCIFIYAEKKDKLVAYPKRQSRGALQKLEATLIEDLKTIASMAGEFSLTEAGYVWGEKWYERHYSKRPAHLSDDRFGGYLARKQSHIHKLAMVLTASTTNNLIITEETLALADQMITDIEGDMTKVFSKVGKSDTSVQADRLLNFIEVKGELPYQEVFQYAHTYFPRARDFEDIFAGLVRSGQVKIEAGSGMVKAITKPKGAC